MQQTLSGCVFCDAVPGTEVGKAHTWGKDERVTHAICVDCAVQSNPDPDERDHHACDSCGLVVDVLAALYGSVSNSATWKAHYNCVRDVVPVAPQRTGLAT